MTLPKITYRIMDVTDGSDVWDCGDPPCKVARYGVGKFSDGVLVRGEEGTSVAGLEFVDVKEALRIADRMCEEDFASYVPPEYRKTAWSEQW